MIRPFAKVKKKSFLVDFFSKYLNFYLRSTSARSLFFGSIAIRARVRKKRKKRKKLRNSCPFPIPHSQFTIHRDCHAAREQLTRFGHDSNRIAISQLAIKKPGFWEKPGFWTIREFLISPGLQPVDNGGR